LAIAWSHPVILPLDGSLGDGRIAALGLPGWPAATIIDGVADIDSSVLVEEIDRAEGEGGQGQAWEWRTQWGMGRRRLLGLDQEFDERDGG
jgi:hypothetical protein